MRTATRRDPLTRCVLSFLVLPMGTSLRIEHAYHAGNDFIQRRRVDLLQIACGAILDACLDVETAHLIADRNAGGVVSHDGNTETELPRNVANRGNGNRRGYTKAVDFVCGDYYEAMAKCNFATL